MELVTIACERDIQDLLLQAHSIDKFIQEPCHHWITVEDESLTPEEWHGILAPYYIRHKLTLTFSKRPDLEFDPPFTLGWRRQQILKLTTAAMAMSDNALVLDCKNIFVRPTDLSLWPFKNGNGRYIFPHEKGERYLPTKWVDYIHRKTGMMPPEKHPGMLEAPFACTTKYVRDCVSYPLFYDLFLQTDGVIPMAEWHYYYFFVPEEELDEPKHVVCSAATHLDITGDIDEFIGDQISFCVDVDSPTHGLHRQVRKMMTRQSKERYSDWLVSIGLNKQLVDDYVYFEMPDITWGM
jgi:hypothetical protein